MRRVRRIHHYDNDSDYHQSNDLQYETLHNSNSMDDFGAMKRMPRNGVQTQFMEAKVEAGDTLQALALRFHCSVADIKRLNKIDKDNEIHARKVVRIPVTVHTILLGTLPTVHKSGNSSPKNIQKTDDEDEHGPDLVRNPLEDASVMLSEKLLVASVNAAGSNIAKSQFTENSTHEEHHRTIITSEHDDATSPLITDILDDSVAQPHPLRGPSLSAIDWSGTDCDMSWVCLFVFIMALCFVIPLVYVIYLAEHTHHNTTTLH